MKASKLCLWLLLTLWLTGCSVAPVPTNVPPVGTTLPTDESIATTAPAEESDYVDQLLSEMTLRQKIGQLFIIRPDSLDLDLTQEQINDPKENGVTEVSDLMISTLRNYPAGGIVLFGKNIESPDQITNFTDQLQGISEIPLFMCVDEEGGLVSRLANHRAFDLPAYESAAAVAAERDSVHVWEMGQTIGGYLKENGFNLDFAPVADVNTNPDNPVIGSRAFSSDPMIAAQMVSAMAEGLRSEGVIATFKHFPGHGNTAEDSHEGIAVTYRTASQMAKCEWLPFLSAGSDDLIMVGHIAAPEITGVLIPATMSGRMVNDILKGELGFQGLVITDSLAMDAITDTYDPGEAALGALNAGCDLLLMPNGYTQAFDAVVEAVENGTFPEARLNDTVERIPRFKQSHDLLLSNGVG